MMKTQEAFVDNVDQDQTAHNVQSDLWSTLTTFFKLDYGKTFVMDKISNWLIHKDLYRNIFAHF